MTPAPPPHERAWRHPSELPAPPHEPPTRGGRLLVVATGAIGLALVGVLAVRMTPGPSSQGDALVTVTTGAALSTAGAAQVTQLATVASEVGGRFTETIGRTLSSLLPGTSAPNGPADDAPASAPEFAVVTPVGSERLGLTTAAAVAGGGETIEAMLPTGEVVSARLLATDGGVAVVELPELPEPRAATDAVGLAEARAARGGLTVIAYGDQLRVGATDGLRALSVPEASPIFDLDGNLVGLCTLGPDGIEMLTVESLPDIGDPPEPADLAAVASTEPTEDTSADTGVDTTATIADTEPAEPPATSSPNVPGTTPASTDAAEPSSPPVASTDPPDASLSDTTDA